ncbi:ABC transporter ATP-binding protein [Lactiplantibacillus plantarum]|nr:ABC transporter ATP-binding protein [Lactiplantibacillus plantarum]AVW09011.1 ABC transporter ATP-binding protein [Lactiplantibacillus plantarum]
MVNTILKEADLFCPNSVRINFTIYRLNCLSMFTRRIYLVMPQFAQ